VRPAAILRSRRPAARPRLLHFFTLRATLQSAALPLASWRWHRELSPGMLCYLRLIGWQSSLDLDAPLLDYWHAIPLTNSPQPLPTVTHWLSALWSTSWTKAGRLSLVAASLTLTAVPSGSTTRERSCNRLEHQNRAVWRLSSGSLISVFKQRSQGYHLVGIVKFCRLVSEQRARRI
jgi:hypothetical protein